MERSGGSGGGSGGGRKALMGAPAADGTLSVTPEADVALRPSPLDFDDAGPWADDDDGGARKTPRADALASAAPPAAANSRRLRACAGPGPGQLYGASSGARGSELARPHRAAPRRRGRLRACASGAR